MIYEKVFSPLLKKHEKQINEVIEKVQLGTSEIASEAKKVAADIASPENIAKVTEAVKEIIPEKADEAKKED